MTVLDVKNAVIAYGFNYDLDDNDDLFVKALNNAAQEINRIRPTTATVVIVHEPYEPSFTSSEITDIADGMSFAAMARSAVFEVDGEGQVSVSAEGASVSINGESTSTVTWNVKTGWKRIEVKASAYTNITISFSGTYLFRMRNMAFYTEAVPPTAHIKSGDFVDYDLKALAEEYASISYILRGGLGYVGSETYRVLNNRILRIPTRDRGTYEVIYNKHIPVLGIDEATHATEIIPLREDTLDALPVLVASYVWLDDNPERAQHYRALFGSLMASVPTETYITHIRDTRGWS